MGKAKRSDTFKMDNKRTSFNTPVKKNAAAAQGFIGDVREGPESEGKFFQSGQRLRKSVLIQDIKRAEKPIISSTPHHTKDLNNQHFFGKPMHVLLSPIWLGTDEEHGLINGNEKDRVQKAVLQKNSDYISGEVGSNNIKNLTDGLENDQQKLKISSRKSKKDQCKKRTAIENITNKQDLKEFKINQSYDSHEHSHVKRPDKSTDKSSAMSPIKLLSAQRTCTKKSRIPLRTASQEKDKASEVNNNLQTNKNQSVNKDHEAESLTPKKDAATSSQELQKSICNSDVIPIIPLQTHSQGKKPEQSNKSRESADDLGEKLIGQNERRETENPQTTRPKKSVGVQSAPNESLNNSIDASEDTLKNADIVSTGQNINADTTEDRNTNPLNDLMADILVRKNRGGRENEKPKPQLPNKDVEKAENTDINPLTVIPVEKATQTGAISKEDKLPKCRTSLIVLHRKPSMPEVASEESESAVATMGSQISACSSSVPDGFDSDSDRCASKLLEEAYNLDDKYTRVQCHVYENENKDNSSVQGEADQSASNNKRKPNKHRKSLGDNSVPELTKSNSANSCTATATVIGSTCDKNRKTADDPVEKLVEIISSPATEATLTSKAATIFNKKLPLNHTTSSFSESQSQKATEEQEQPSEAVIGERQMEGSFISKASKRSKEDNVNISRVNSSSSETKNINLSPLVDPQVLEIRPLSAVTTSNTGMGGLEGIHFSSDGNEQVRNKNKKNLSKKQRLIGIESQVNIHDENLERTGPGQRIQEVTCKSSGHDNKENNILQMDKGSAGNNIELVVHSNADRPTPMQVRHGTENTKNQGKTLSTIDKSNVLSNVVKNSETTKNKEKDQLNEEVKPKRGRGRPKKTENQVTIKRKDLIEENYQKSRAEEKDEPKSCLGQNERRDTEILQNTSLDKSVGDQAVPNESLNNLVDTSEDTLKNADEGSIRQNISADNTEDRNTNPLVEINLETSLGKNCTNREIQKSKFRWQDKCVENTEDTDINPLANILAEIAAKKRPISKEDSTLMPNGRRKLVLPHQKRQLIMITEVAPKKPDAELVVPTMSCSSSDSGDYDWDSDSDESASKLLEKAYNFDDAQTHIQWQVFENEVADNLRVPGEADQAASHSKTKPNKPWRFLGENLVPELFGPSLQTTGCYEFSRDNSINSRLGPESKSSSSGNTALATGTCKNISEGADSLGTEDQSQNATKEQGHRQREIFNKLPKNNSTRTRTRQCNKKNLKLMEEPVHKRMETVSSPTPEIPKDSRISHKKLPLKRIRSSCRQSLSQKATEEQDQPQASPVISKSTFVSSSGEPQLLDIRPLTAVVNSNTVTSFLEANHFSSDENEQVRTNSKQRIQQVTGTKSGTSNKENDILQMNERLSPQDVRRGTQKKSLSKIDTSNILPNLGEGRTQRNRRPVRRKTDIIIDDEFLNKWGSGPRRRLKDSKKSQKTSEWMPRKRGRSKITQNSDIPSSLPEQKAAESCDVETIRETTNSKERENQHIPQEEIKPKRGRGRPRKVRDQDAQKRINENIANTQNELFVVPETTQEREKGPPEDQNLSVHQPMENESMPPPEASSVSNLTCKIGTKRKSKCQSIDISNINNKKSRNPSTKKAKQTKKTELSNSIRRADIEHASKEVLTPEPTHEDNLEDCRLFNPAATPAQSSSNTRIRNAGETDQDQDVAKESEPTSRDLEPSLASSEQTIEESRFLTYIDSENVSYMVDGELHDVQFATRVEPSDKDFETIGKMDMCRLFTDPNNTYCGGFIRLQPGQRKRLSISRINHFMYCVLKGNALLLCKNRSCIIATGGAFMIRAGQEYFMQNLDSRSDLVMFFSKFRHV